MNDKMGFGTKVAIFVSILAIFISSITLYRMYVSKSQDDLAPNAIDFTSNFGKYTPISANSADGTLVVVKGVVTYDIDIVKRRYVLGNIDKDFVYRQLKAICEAQILKRYASEMKQSDETINKIKSEMDVNGISVFQLNLEIR